MLERTWQSKPVVSYPRTFIKKNVAIKLACSDPFKKKAVTVPKVWRGVLSCDMIFLKFIFHLFLLWQIVSTWVILILTQCVLCVLYTKSSMDTFLDDDQLRALGIETSFFKTSSSFQNHHKTERAYSMVFISLE